MTDFKRFHQSNKIVLLILSGDRSSFFSACYLIEQGYNVYMVTYNNGCISDVDNIKGIADRIIKKYDSSKALFLGVQSVTAYLYRFQEPFLYSTIGEFSKKYPNLHPGQLPCLPYGYVREGYCIL